MGARPLQRVIDTDIKRDLSRMMLFGDLKSGGHLVVDAVNDSIVLTATKEDLVEETRD